MLLINPNTHPFLILCWPLFFSMGCQSSPKLQFEKLSPGMEKGEVLGFMGPPSANIRFAGKDRWIYRFYDNDERFVKEVHFQDGKAVYIGDEFQAPPELQAATLDAVNARREVEISEAETKRKEALKESYLEYQRRSQLDDKVRYLPKFQPIR